MDPQKMVIFNLPLASAYVRRIFMSRCDLTVTLDFEDAGPSKVMRASAPPSPPEASASSVPSIELRIPAQDLLPSISALFHTSGAAVATGTDQTISQHTARTADSPGYALRRRSHAAKVRTEVRTEESRGRMKAEGDDSAVEYQQTVEALLLLSDSP